MRYRRASVSAPMGVDEGGCLVFPARQPRHAAWLRFRPDGLHLSCGEARCVLDWDSFDPSSALMSAHWALGEYQGSGGGAPVGIAVNVGTVLRPTTDDVLHATRSWRHPVDVIGCDGIPVIRGAVATAANTLTLGTLGALCAVIHDRGEVRPRLEDPGRMRRLATAVSTASLGPGPRPRPRIRTRVEIETAMNQCGLIHRYGRPLLDEPITELSVACERVTAYLARSPYVVGMHFGTTEIESQINDNYASIQPWPFGPLTSAS